MDNLINIKCLDSKNIIEQLDIRYTHDIIYTKIDNILIAVNPFKKISKHLDQPHPDFIADTMINGMINHQKNQSVLISGESGAGKTETTKILLNKLLTYDNKSDKNNNLGEMILASNIILESFGNACTIRNHNSSRFGKLITLLYDSSNAIVGAEIKTYLLEKIRVTDKDISEKNFHIFYILNDIIDTNIVKTTSTSDDYFDGPDTMISLIKSFKIFELDDMLEDIKNILKIIIYLPSYSTNINKLAILFDIPIDNLLLFLEKQMITVGGEIIYKNLSKQEIDTKIKTLSQELYSNLFDFVVKTINKKLQPTIKSDKYMKINLLDIFGFEILNTNSIEQLCINYTNEILQNEFNKYFFEKEQQLYLKEGLIYDMVDFKNNDDIIDCIEKQVFGIINEVTKFIKPKDMMIIDKLNKIQDNFPYIIVSNLDYGKQRFKVKHYANIVNYNSKHFISKNGLNLSNDIVNLINNSNNKLIALFNIKSSKNLLLNNFYKQIRELQKVINITEVNFIKCLKPNDENTPNNMNANKIEIQLTYNGIIEAIAIVRQGYPIRYPNKEFDKVFKIIPNEYKKDIIRGNTLTFLKTEEELKLLEIKQKILNNKATIICKNYRAYYYYKRYQSILFKTILIQKYLRRFISRIHYIKILSSITIQSVYRYYKARKLYYYLRSIVKVQSVYRCYQSRSKFINLQKKIIIIQKFIKTKISSEHIRLNTYNNMINKSSNIIIRFFRYNRFCNLRNKIVNIGKQYLIKRKMLEEEEKEKASLKELEKQKIMNNIRLMEEEDYLTRRIRTEEKNMMIKNLNRQNLKNALLITSLNNEREGTKNMIEHLNNEKEELLQAIAKKDIILLQKIAHLEENLYHINSKKEENKCIIM